MERKLYKFCIFKYIDEEGTKNLHLITLMHVFINFGKKHFSKNHEEGKTHIKDNKISSCFCPSCLNMINYYSCSMYYRYLL